VTLHYDADRRHLQNGYQEPIPSFDCELVLRENDHESRQPHSFVDEIRPGTFTRIEGRDWVVIEVRGGASPEVLCRPVYERL
jgi:hypothetical protein